MQPWLEHCESWLQHQYQGVLGLSFADGPVRLRWLSADSLTNETARIEAEGLAIEDSDIGWLLFLLPYGPDRIEQQVNQALGLRSRLLREYNYTGREKADDNEDLDSTWRVGLVWLVGADKWSDWQRRILEIRRESGAAEEISFDAVQVVQNNARASLDAHGLPRLLLYTRALLNQSAEEAETWLSADAQVSTVLENFTQQFNTPRARTFARELGERAKSFHSEEIRQPPFGARQFRRFRVKHFRNLNTLEIVGDSTGDAKAQAIILFGPNGTGKSSFAEALSLAAFRTSPQLERFVEDEDIPRATAEIYLREYLTPLSSPDDPNTSPCFAWASADDTPFNLNTNEENKRRFEGVVLNQEDSLKFTELSREELAVRVLRGYSALADYLSGWLAQEEKRANEKKLAFTRKHGLGGATKLSVTAYKGLAQKLLSEQLQRPSPEFLDWLRFVGRLSGDDGRYASKIVSDWIIQQDNVVSRLPETVAKLHEKGASQAQIAQAIREKLVEFDELANQASDFRQHLESQIVTLREQLDVALTQIESWGEWLVSRTTTQVAPGAGNQIWKVEIESFARERTELEKNGKALHGRLDLLDQAKQFLENHWTAQHPDTCPVCNSDVSGRQGIEVVVATLQEETNTTIQALRARHVEIQKRQKELDTKLKAAGVATCPLASEDQTRLKDWLQPFLPPEGASLEEWLSDPQRRRQLKGDLLRMRILPEPPKRYADAAQEAERLASVFSTLAQEADRALEDPQSIGEVKKAFEQRMEEVLKEHLPSTLGKVWREITLTLTTASWLLPDRPTLKLEQRGKALSVRADRSDQYIRYIYNAAERHVLGLAWFLTHYLAKRRFEEAWMLLDDPAQEMDQPSFRELVRLWETLLRMHQRKGHPLTMIVALHQEERALDAARATNGRLYILGWQKEQRDTSTQTSVKKVVLLAPGFHPLKPETMFS